MSLLTIILRQSRKSDRRGVTLVVVLGMLALMAVLMISYLSSASTELAAAKRYSSGLDARALTDSAVNIVISQIQDATSTPTLAWASQPGMLRTYDDAGQPVMAYKLYSSDQLRVTGSFNPLLSVASEVPAGWANQKSLYADINKPVSVSGVKHYPIIYPSAVANAQGSNTALDGSGSPIEGCYLDTGNAATTTSSTQPNPVPMPVQWMYVLKNGTVAGMDPATKRVAGAGAMLPDGTQNVITGRIAFWTDDESSKVNVNTASEGTFWTRPWAYTEYDVDLAKMMPVQNEFQRFPGHPATTSLSVVFPPAVGESDLDYKNRIYGMVPRVSGGGSNAGTTIINNKSAAIVPDAQRLFASVDEFLFQGVSPAQAGGTSRAVQPAPSGNLSQADVEKARFFITTSSSAPEVNLWNKPRITLWPLQANTSDVGNPTAATDRNATDKLIAFCSTIGSKPYYFQRYNTYTSATQTPQPSSQSPTDDWTKLPRNQELYAYLQDLTNRPVPGLGGTLGGVASGNKYIPRVRDQILTQMMDYIRSSLNTFSGGMTPKYYYTPFSPTGFVKAQGQIVPLELPNGTKGHGRFPTIQQAAICFYRKDKLTVTGKTVPTTVLTGTSVDFLGDLRTGVNAITVKEGNPPYTDPCTMNAVIILQPYNVTPGTPPWAANVRLCIEDANGLQVNGSSMGFPNKMVNLVTSIGSTINATPFAHMEEFLQKPTRSPKIQGTTTPDSPDEAIYPFFSDNIPIVGSTFTFSGDMTLKIYQGKTGPLNNDDLIQTIKFSFPSMTLPIPTVYYSISYTKDADGNMVTRVAHDNDYTSWDERNNRQIKPTGRWGYADDGGHQPLPIFRPNDTVRSVEVRGGGVIRGDLRLLSGLKNVPAEFFEAHGEKDWPSSDGKKYSDSTIANRLMHSVRIHLPGNGDTSNQNGFYYGTGAGGDKRGKLVKNAPYRDPNRGNSSRNSRMPTIPRGVEQALMSDGITLGDWDNGPGTQPDGPYINKGDEGASNFTQSGNGPYFEGGGYINGAGVVESGSSFAPNRQVASAVTFGSLPSGIDPDDTITTATPKSKPWQTLLFCKNPAGGSTHPGFGIPASGPPYTTPPDHAFLDLFTMPVVEPYAISEPFATAGKVNMNYQIVPFTYLTRDTGVRAVLKSVNMMAIPTLDADKYKDSAYDPPNYYYNLNLNETTGTLAGFEQRFATGDIFRSASEICDIYLVPGSLVKTGTPPAGTPSYNTMQTWWQTYLITGDNTREAPYGSIYPRLTTKSNTYTVHVMTQAIKKGRNSAADEFVDGQDTVTSEFRGSVLIQRYLDPNADYLVKADGLTPAGELDADAMVGPYKFRVLSTKQFSP
ncbi:MAG: Verru_Chthon cassette protein A [Candidatus Methylacidiphilales bacterium]|nr:Verru_Chthon cassette protein A [Candidatus Methylacidiphilales bacterium]